jgi:hypothetical protein
VNFSPAIALTYNSNLFIIVKKDINKSKDGEMAYIPFNREKGPRLRALLDKYMSTNITPRSLNLEYK